MFNRLKLIGWVFKEQFNVSKPLFAWKFFYSVYDGLNSIVYVYVSAKIISSVTQVVLSNGSSTPVYQWLGLMLGFEILMQCVSALNGIFERRLTQLTDMRFNEMLMRKLYHLSQSQFENEKFHEQISRAQDGLFSTESTLREISWLTSSVVRVVGATISISTISPIVTAAVVVLTIPGAIVRFKNNRYQEKVYRENETNQRITYRTRWLLLDHTVMPEIRIVNGFKQLINEWKKYKNINDKSVLTMDKKLAYHKVLTDTLEPITFTFSFVMYFRALLSKSIGLDQFLFARSITEQFMSSIQGAALSIDNLDQRLIEVQNLKDVLDTKTDLPNGSVVVNKPLKIEFKNVCFKYPSSQSNILEKISFVIHPGSKLAIVGENGAGKSTLLKLILRIYLPTSGQILVNGVDIADIEQESYYKQISNLSQDFLSVSHLRIKDNLLLGIDDRSDKEINSILDIVEAKNFVQKLKYGLDSRLDTSFKEGTQLSGGQMQRLGVARALLRNGDILILDEPTSAIDAKAEYTIFNNIYKHHQGKTTLIVSHRFSTVRKADAILVMESGKITEYGSHDDLIKHGGLYKEMFELQAEGYK